MIDGFHQALRARLDEMIQRKRDEICQGYGTNAEALLLQYKFNTGYLAALQTIAEVAEEVEQKLYNPDKGER